MKTIYKYPISISTDTEFIILDVPDGAQFLHVAPQQNKICLWALVDTEAIMTKRQIRVIGTGRSAEDVNLGQYIGSVLVLKGTYTLHIFDAGTLIQ
jgi:hypothetical protein